MQLSFVIQASVGPRIVEKMTFPSPGRVDRNSGRVCKNSQYHCKNNFDTVISNVMTVTENFPNILRQKMKVSNLPFPFDRKVDKNMLSNLPNLTLNENWCLIFYLNKYE